MYRPIKECFIKSEEIRASHLLYTDFLQERSDISKFIFYLWLNENELGVKHGKDFNGNLGYGLKYIKSQKK